jgi:hypothetical protein
MEKDVVVGSLEMLSGRSKKEYAKEAEAVAAASDGAPAANGAAENDLRAFVWMKISRATGLLPRSRPPPTINGAGTVDRGPGARPSGLWTRVVLLRADKTRPQGKGPPRRVGPRPPSYLLGRP